MITNRMKKHSSVCGILFSLRNWRTTIRLATTIVLTSLALPVDLQAAIVGFNPQSNLILLNVANKQSGLSVPDQGVPWNYDFAANLTALGVTGDAVGGIQQSASASASGIGFPIATTLSVTGRPEPGSLPVNVLFAGSSSGVLNLSVSPATILSAQVEFEVQGFLAEGDTLRVGVVGYSDHAFQQDYVAAENWVIDTPGPFSLQLHESSMPVPTLTTAREYGWLLEAVFSFEVSRGASASNEATWVGFSDPDVIAHELTPVPEPNSVFIWGVCIGAAVAQRTVRRK
jgi:hypothetical protein